MGSKPHGLERRAVRNAGLEIVHTVSREVEVSVNPWLDLTGVEPEMKRTILDELTHELGGLTTTGMRPFMRDNELMFALILPPPSLQPKPGIGTACLPYFVDVVSVGVTSLKAGA